MPAGAVYIAGSHLNGGTNVYAYVGNDPINNVDPLGLDWINFLAQIADVVDAVTPGDLADLSDFAAGFGDNMSFGISKLIRRGMGMGIDDLIDYCSGAYSGGQWTSTAVSIAATGGSALLKGLAARASRTAVRTAAQPFVNAVPGSGGFVHHINTLFGHPGVPVAPFFPTGGLPAWIHSGAWNLTRLPNRGAHLAAHQAAKFWDRLGALFFHGAATAGRLGLAITQPSCRR